MYIPETSSQIMKKIIVLLLFMSLSNIIYSQITNKDEETVLESKTGPFGSLLNYANKTIFQYLDKSSQAPSTKPFDFSVIGGPYYTNETKVGLGLIGSGLFRLSGCETDSLPSNVSLYTDLTTSGAYAVGIRSNILFPHKKYWLQSDAFFSDTPSRYWGVGYEAGRDNSYTKYNIQEVQIKLSFFKKTSKYGSVGIVSNLQDMRGKYIDDITYFDERKRKSTAIGFGINYSYDSRDVPTNAYRGSYINVENIFYPNAFSNSSGFNKLGFIFRHYKQMWEGSVIAFDFDANIGRGDVPWTMMALVGNASQMRGYYMGRYRDKNLIDAQIELRQHIYKRSGAVAWFGGGNIFSRFRDFQWDETLPTYGLGYRFRVKARTNLRFDYGFGKNQNAFYININEAF